MYVTENLPSNVPVWCAPDKTATLITGDSLALLSHLPDNSIDCVWTDPPYNLSNDGVTCVAGKMVPVNKGEWDRSMGIEGDYQFNLAWTKECYRVLRPTGTIWVTGTVHVHSSVGMALQRNGFRLLNDIIWEKTNPPPNLGCRTFTHSTELMYWASKAQKKDKIKYKFNYKLMKEINGGKQMKTVWRFGSASKSERKFGKHPTQKPVELIKRSILASTVKGDLILDPFSGSGSTGIAALALNRNFIGIEQKKEYADLSIKRLESTFSQKSPNQSLSPPPPCHLTKFMQQNNLLSFPRRRLPISAGNRSPSPKAWKKQRPSVSSRPCLGKIFLLLR